MFLASLVLLFPFLVNPIIWTDCQLFDNSEILCPLPSCSELRANEVLSPMGRAAPPRPITEASPIETRKILYLQKRGGRTSVETWTLDTYSDAIGAVNRSPDYNARAHYTKDWQLKHFRLTDPSHDYEAWVVGSTLYVKLDREEPQAFELEDGYPWIQQTTFGLRKFILTKKRKRLDFYGYAPPPLNTIVHTIAEKKEEKEIPGFGKCIKVHLYPHNWLLQRFGDTEAWFNTKSGDLVRIETKITLMPTTILELQP